MAQWATHGQMLRAMAMITTANLLQPKPLNNKEHEGDSVWVDIALDMGQWCLPNKE